MLILNNFSVLCIWLEERVKREERDILLRPVEAEQKQKQKHQHQHHPQFTIWVLPVPHQPTTMSMTGTQTGRESAE